MTAALFMSHCFLIHDGTGVWAESTLGKGAAFNFTLPAVARG